MDVVHDVLDTQVVDRNGRMMGRADSIILDVEEGRPPRFVAIEIGPAPLAERLHARLGAWVRAVERALDVAAGRPVRIPCGSLRFEEQKVIADVAISDTGAGNVEKRLRLLLRGRWS